MVETENFETGPTGQPASDDTSDRPVLSVDCERYERFLRDNNLTDDEKREFLKALWTIIVDFVDLGFGVHPLQQACEQPAGKTTDATVAIVSSNPRDTKQDIVAASDPQDRKMAQEEDLSP
ncbi:hypothetical protein [Ruegeria sp.]|uniref:hypothetical protein n=1 Tax=Ruegeria sp. TaxID=1879320 RepID=UPI003B006C3D